MKKKWNGQLSKSLFGLVLFIVICAFLARYLTDSETLADYAKNNPEAAYGTQNDVSAKEVDANANESVDEEALAEESVGDKALTEESVGDEAHINETNDFVATENMTILTENFYYEPLTDEVKQRITGISYPVSASEADSLAIPAINLLEEEETAAITYEDLRYLSILHYDFDGKVQTGELICHKAVADDLLEIFYELYQNEYQIEKIKLIDDYQGNDTASMADNNTSCFNYRVVDGTSSLSKHALGCAVDINPFYNPYVVFGKGENGGDYISPAGSEIYADRSKSFAYKIDENDLCYKLFKEHGFIWGGNWNSCKDYQHFQKDINY